jgi:hypothetical protein
MELKVNYNMKAISLKDIKLPTMAIEKGQVFYLKDAYKEKDAVVIGIQTDYGIEEAGFKIPIGKKIKTRDDLRTFINSFIIKYLENCNYYFIT